MNIKSTAPSFRALSSLLTSFWTVRKITGTFLNLSIDLIVPNTSNPSTLGILISSNIKSGVCVSKNFIVCTADVNSVTLKCGFKDCSTNLRFVISSSTTNICFIIIPPTVYHNHINKIRHNQRI